MNSLSNMSIPPAEIGDDELAEISLILAMRRNFNMSVYKDKCMKRRVAIRMRATHCSDVSAYCCLLRGSETELNLLQKALTIHVSQFFRNPGVYDFLRRDVVPALMASCRASGRNALRVWCLGCASGEEPYSVAIMLCEHFWQDLEQVPVSILATDIDDGIIDIARAAIYSEDRLKEVGSDLREKYFRREGEAYRLIPEIRNMVAFRQDDIMATDRYVACDAVFCRNTLIYFTRADQEKILVGIADILPADGILVLGKSESLVGEARRKFVAVNASERIYRRVVDERVATA